MRPLRAHGDVPENDQSCCSRVDTRERAGMIFAGYPEMIRAERIAVHKAANDTDVVFSKTTWMKAYATAHVICD